MNTTPPTECPAWAKLAAHAEGWKGSPLAALFAGDARRGEHFGAQAPGLHLDYSRQRVGALTLRLLTQLLEERGFAAWRAALFEGAPINATEGRAVRHAALRAGEAAPAQAQATLATSRSDSP
jgi:glucose-6-phosphate isomerase